MAVIGDGAKRQTHLWTVELPCVPLFTYLVSIVQTHERDFFISEICSAAEGGGARAAAKGASQSKALLASPMSDKPGRRCDALYATQTGAISLFICCRDR